MEEKLRATGPEGIRRSKDFYENNMDKHQEKDNLGKSAPDEFCDVFERCLSHKDRKEKQ